MSRTIRSVLVAAVMFVAGATGQTLKQATDLSKRLGLQFSGEERVRLEGFTGAGFRPDSSDAYVLNRLRLNMKVAPSSWLKFQFQMQDARVWWKNQKPYAPPFQTTFDLRQGYIEVGDVEKKPIALRVGRQEINLGEERLVGSSNWTNTARTFDAVRAAMRYGKVRLDAFSASPVMLRDGRVGDHQPGNNLHGLYGAIDKAIPKATVEPYLFWRLSQRLKTELGATGNLDFTTIGVRWFGKLPRNFDYSMDMVKQQGSLGTDRIGAWAGHWVAGYTLTNAPYKSRVFAQYDYASGDRDSTDGRRGTFDQLFPTPHDKYSLTDQVGWRNTHVARTGVEFKPVAKWAIAAKYGAYWLADAHDALYTAAGAAIARKADGSAGRFVGTELGAIALYSPSKHLQVGGGFGHLFPGAFLNNVTPGRSYNSPYLMLGTTF